MKLKRMLYVFVFLFVGLKNSVSEPVVINGSMIPLLVGTELNKIRLCNSKGDPIPFQIDEITKDGEYVCPYGEQSNEDSSNGVFDVEDEIAFLWSDCSNKRIEKLKSSKNNAVTVAIKNRDELRYILICDDESIGFSQKKYIQYDHEKQMLSTPFFYAQFAKDRFHFVSAGVKDIGKDQYVNLTNELRVKILLKALWGLIPIRYSENNLICIVKRYKVGPIRVIRRGDFHLNLGLGIKGSRAAVNQICYPSIVKVPVYVHVPVRFRSFFGEAYIEITPVINSAINGYNFFVPKADFCTETKGTEIDTLLRFNPNNEYMSVNDGTRGYGWVLEADIADTFLQNSSFVFRRPSIRKGSSDCGFRMTLRDLPKGHYEITNWVLFPGYVPVKELGEYFESGIFVSEIITDKGKFRNHFAESPSEK